MDVDMGSFRHLVRRLSHMRDVILLVVCAVVGASLTIIWILEGSAVLAIGTPIIFGFIFARIEMDRRRGGQKSDA